MASEGIPQYLALRVLDNNTGAVIVPDLAHAHDVKWEVRALQQGMPGSSTLGTFTFHSPGGPQSDDFGRWRGQWTQLAIGQRVEAYLGRSVTGAPRFSGIITDMHRPLDSPWEVTGVDSLWMLQQSQTLPGESILVATTRGSDSAVAYYGTQEVLWDDDFSGWNASTHPNSSDYAVSHWSFTSSDPVFGLPALTSTSVSPTEAGVSTHTTWSADSFGVTPSQFVPSVVTIHGVMVAGTGTNNACEASIFLESDATIQNGYMVQALMRLTNATFGLYSVDLVIWTRVAGTDTQRARVNDVFANMGATFPFELSAVFCLTLPTMPNNLASSQWTIRAILNGKDPGCTYGGFVPSGSGGIGLRFEPDASGSPQVFVNRMQFRWRTSGDPYFTNPDGNRFVQGTKVDYRDMTQTVAANGQTNLDVLCMAMTFDGVFIRKTPGAGHKSDVLDYSNLSGDPSPGTDYSSSIVLEEGVNIMAQDTMVATVPEMLGNSVKFNAVPGGDSGGQATWSAIGAIGDAVLTDTVTDVGITGFTMLVNHARQIQARKTNPLQARQVRVVRDRSWLSVAGGAGPRELDYVQIYIPSLNVQRQTALIMGYDFQEGEASMLVYLSQLPAAAAPNHLLQRVQRPLDYISTTYQTR